MTASCRLDSEARRGSLPARQCRKCLHQRTNSGAIARRIARRHIGFRLSRLRPKQRQAQRANLPGRSASVLRVAPRKRRARGANHRRRTVARSRDRHVTPFPSNPSSTKRSVRFSEKQRIRSVRPHVEIRSQNGLISQKKATPEGEWRKEWDSNPRLVLPNVRFRVECLKPGSAILPFGLGFIPSARACASAFFAKSHPPPNGHAQSGLYPITPLSGCFRVVHHSAAPNMTSSVIPSAAPKGQSRAWPAN